MKSQTRATGNRRKVAPKNPSGAKRSAGSGTRSGAASPPATAPKVVASGTPAPVEFSNVEKVMFPGPGYTKGDLLKFYLAIAPRLLPHLRDRPVTLERLPGGVGPGGPRFWQKNTPPYYPKWISRINLPSEAGKPVHYALVNDERTLAYLVNQGTVTFHTWFSRVEDLDRPDFVVFDLDPGEAAFADVVTIAKTLHGLLDEQKAESFPKTSGKSGLHVVVPWRQAGGYDEARAWAMNVAEAAVAELPGIATVERAKLARGGRVYVDVMQNARGHHAVPAYVCRATADATVSTPLEWREVNARLDPKKFTIRTVLKRLDRAKSDLMPV